MKQSTSPPRRPRHMPGDPVHKDEIQAPAVHPVNRPFATVGPKSLQWTHPKDPRTTDVDLKTRLEKAEEDLKKAKQDLDLKTRLKKAGADLEEAKEGLKAREMQARARKQKPAKHNTAEEELRVKIETAKKDIRAKEESVAARRARKDAKREEWIIKQKTDYEKREVKRQENACIKIKAEAHRAEANGVELTSTGAAEEIVVKEEEFDIEFDIDIYGDE
jgi:hypothetical protein